jgi:rare lipoprotein A (peptidoglycan hydrolase)
MKRNFRKLGLNTPLGIWLMAGVSSFALAGVVVTFVATRTVHADSRLPRPVATTFTVAPPLTAPTPESLISQQSALKAEQTAIKRGDRLHGIASWYGGVFNGRKTASGERYDMYALTACHPTLPFGSLVRVVNKANRHSVVVRIVDRGDLVDEGRIIDLSYGAASRLAMTKAGLAKVDLQVLSLGGFRHPN